jgi:nucleoside-diphosphate-sugar epimerase
MFFWPCGPSSCGFKNFSQNGGIPCRKAIKEYLLPQPGDVERTYADITKAAKDLGYKPSTSIQTGLAKFVACLRENN